MPVTLREFSVTHYVMHRDIVILGAGLVGSAAAWALGKRGLSNVHVLDVDLAGTFSSSERNAGGVRHLWRQPINSELSRLSIDYYQTIATEIGFHAKGYLWLFSNEQRADGEKTLAFARQRGLPYEALEVSEIRRRYPFIDKADDLAFGLFGTRDGILNSNALKEHYRQQAIKCGVTFHDGLWAHSLQVSGGKVHFQAAAVTGEQAIKDQVTAPESRVTSESTPWTCDRLVIAAGAWSRELLKPHLKDVITFPVRRQMSFFKVEDFDMTPYGMVVDTSRVYFHPEGGNVVSGIVLKNEPRGYRFNYDDNFFEEHIWPSLYERSSQFERIKHISGWGGLYSYTPDITGILGEVPGLPHVYEAHSFTGHGVMQSYAAGQLLAEKICEGRYQTLDATPLSRTRFDRNQPLTEDLHI